MMSAAMRLRVFCPLVVVCFCENSLPTCTENIHGGDDRCEFLQGDVGVLNRHAGNSHGNEMIDSRKHARGNLKKHVGAKEDADGIPDFIHAVTEILKGVAGSGKNLDDIEQEILKFKAEVTSSTKNLIAHVKAPMSFQNAMALVDTFYAKIWVAAKKLLHAIKKAHWDLTDVGKMPWMPSGFKSYLDTVLLNIERTGDNFVKLFHDKAGLYNPGNTTMACAKMTQLLHNIEAQASDFAKSMFGLSTAGIKQQAKELYKVLPANAKKEVDKLLSKMDGVAQHLMGNLPSSAQEIVDGVAQALHSYCPNLVGSKGSSMQSKVGFTAIFVVSAIALSL